MKTNKVEIYVNGIKEDEFDMSDNSLDLLFEDVCNILTNEIIEKGE